MQRPITEKLIATLRGARDLNQMANATPPQTMEAMTMIESFSSAEAQRVFFSGGKDPLSNVSASTGFRSADFYNERLNLCGGERYNAAQDLC